MDESTVLGTLAEKNSLDKLLEQIELGLKEGGKMILDGRNITEEHLKKGYFLKPTIVECTSDNHLFQEETFGPIFAVTKYKDLEEGIRIANDTKYGLSGVVIGGDAAKVEEVALQIEAGMLYVNESQKSGSEQPSGGIKDSGFGRECGRWGLEEFANIKSVIIKN